MTSFSFPPPQALDLLQRLCENRSYQFLRLDGKTPTSKRQSLVDRFNDRHCKVCKYCLIFSPTEAVREIRTTHVKSWSKPGCAGKRWQHVVLDSVRTLLVVVGVY